MKRTGNTILVTGGGSGIGAAIAHRLDDLGNTVIVAGRGMHSLQQTIAGRSNMSALEYDAADAGAVASFCETLTRKHPSLNVIFNGAGIMKFEKIDAARDLADAEAEVATNLLGPIRLIDGLIDHLKTQPDAVIINVSSGLAFVPLVAAATYSATKAAIHAYTVCLREALKGSVEVLELAPPAVRTGLTPGQENVEAYMPLEDFIDEALALLAEEPTPAELVVDQARFMREAEAKGRFQEVLTALNPH